MTIRIISAEYESAGTIRCAHVWDHIATHIEMSHILEHDPDEHIVVCSECAKLAGLLACENSACEKTILVEAGRTQGELIPMYSPQALVEGCCSRHTETPIAAAIRRTG
jgi:hypothetical protein